MQTADSLRAVGNRNCSNFYRQAIRFYSNALALQPETGGVDENHTASLRLVCLSNRAAAHLARGNFGLVLRDCADAEALYATGPPPPPPPPPTVSPPGSNMSTPPESNGTAPAAMARVMAKCRVRAAAACLRLARSHALPRHAGPLE